MYRERGRDNYYIISDYLTCHYIYIYIYVHAYMYIYTLYTYMRVYVYICICTYTYTHADVHEHICEVSVYLYNVVCARNGWSPHTSCT